MGQNILINMKEISVKEIIESTMIEEIKETIIKKFGDDAPLINKNNTEENTKEILDYYDITAHYNPNLDNCSAYFIGREEI